jgi:pyruvate/2-oxoacid:ferredoxin oxidoreductase alpha subunit
MSLHGCPSIGKVFVQAESPRVAAINMVYGAAGAGDAGR